MKNATKFREKKTLYGTILLFFFFRYTGKLKMLNIFLLNIAYLEDSKFDSFFVILVQSKIEFIYLKGNQMHNYVPI